MASLRKIKGSPYWIACFTSSDGIRTNRSTKTSNKHEATRIALEWEEASKKARKGILVETQARKVVNDILEKVGVETIKTEKTGAYLDKWANNKKNPATSERYRAVTESFKTHLGKKANSSLTAISHNDILGFIEKRKSDGIAPKTVFIDVKILNVAFNLARRLGFIQENPVEKALALNPITVESSERERFTPEQVSKLVQAAEGELRTVVLLGFYTGARLSDCANMKWENVNFENGVIDFLQRKTGKRVVLPIHPKLDEHLQKIAPDKPATFLCPSLAGKETSGEHGLSKSFQRVMEKAGIDPQVVDGKGKRKFSKLSFHSFRHSFNSILANKGVDQETRMTFTGHSSVEINNDYTKLELPKLKEAIEKLPNV